MRVYVASSFMRKDDVRAAQRMIVAAGHVITCDWTTEDATGMAGAALHAYMACAAEGDVAGVLEADAVIVLHDDRGRGMATEVGLALSAGPRVIIVGGRVGLDEMMRNVFYYLPEVIHVDTIAEAVEKLEAL